MGRFEIREPTSPQPWSSLMIMMMLGFSLATAEERVRMKIRKQGAIGIIESGDIAVVEELTSKRSPNSTFLRASSNY